MLWFIGGMITGLMVAAICFGKIERDALKAEEKKNRQRCNADGSKGGVL